MSSSSGRDALEAALAQLLPCTYSLRGSSSRPMAHKTIALTTELRSPCTYPALFFTLLCTSSAQCGSGTLVALHRKVGRHCSACICAAHQPLTAEGAMGPAHLALTGVLGDGQYSAAVLGVA